MRTLLVISCLLVLAVSIEAFGDHERDERSASNSDSHEKGWGKKKHHHHPIRTTTPTTTTPTTTTPTTTTTTTTKPTTTTPTTTTPATTTPTTTTPSTTKTQG
ncbi:coiled-coil domain-containing protein 80-like [Ambystoma mexicanum]|uniref:coiled-coil domain-containing protein 80-like n=1 Tax=Ambystoma mexicanum TaxID=8296 RepID=UPI0037E7EF76